MNYFQKKLIGIHCVILLILFSNNICAQKTNYKHNPLMLEENDKLGILAVHFGSTHEDTREKCIDKLNKEISDKFPNYIFLDAYSSRIVINKLAKEGIKKYTPEQAMDILREQGCTHLVVQSSHIIDGVEMESLRHDIKLNKDKFKEIRIGTPLLYTPDDHYDLISAIESQLPEKEGSVVLIGHGTYTPATATYAMLDYILKINGKQNWHVGTIEGYPTIDQVLAKLDSQKNKRVLLAPLMFVAGEHAKNDIAIEWKQALEDKGYEVDIYMNGLGENKYVRDIYISHIIFAMENEHLDINTKKSKYAREQR